MVGVSQQHINGLEACLFEQVDPSGDRHSVSDLVGRPGPEERRVTWSPDGKELFYLTEDAVVAVAVRSDGTIGAPRRLFDRSNYYLRYGDDVSPGRQQDEQVASLLEEDRRY